MRAEMNRLEDAARMAMAHQPASAEMDPAVRSWRVGPFVLALIALMAAAYALFG